MIQRLAYDNLGSIENSSFSGFKDVVLGIPYFVAPYSKSFCFLAKANLQLLSPVHFGIVGIS